ncbi:MAG: type III-A CRISPR-associated RAMP protein Csm5 [Halothece sp.]
MTDISNLEKPNTYESKIIRLTSPILHIGSSVSQLNPFEYINAGDKVYLPNQEVLARALYSRGKLQDYIYAIENKENIIGLLEDTFNDWKQATDPDGNPIFPSNQINRKWTEKPITQLRPMIRNGWGNFYIPGSSIKGAIRTAIAHHLLKHYEQYQVIQSPSNIEERLREKLNNRELKSKRNQKFADDKLFMNELFSDFSLYHKNQLVLSKTGSNTDFMRAVKVSDSKPLIEKKVKLKNGKIVKRNIPVVSEVIVSSYFEDYKAKYRSSIFAEMVYKISTDFTLTIDTEMLSWFNHNNHMKLPFHTIDELINICREFSQDQWQLETEYWQDIGNNSHHGENLDFDLLWEEYYGKPNCHYQLRLGWGSGMLGTTVNSLFSPEMREDIRDECGIAAPNFPAPKSRRTIKDRNQEISYVPGWVKLTPLSR